MTKDEKQPKVDESKNAAGSKEDLASQQEDPNMNLINNDPAGWEAWKRCLMGGAEVGGGVDKDIIDPTLVLLVDEWGWPSPRENREPR